MKKGEEERDRQRKGRERERERERKEGGHVKRSQAVWIMKLCWRRAGRLQLCMQIKLAS